MNNNNKINEWILHVDGDAFFASCEVSRRPDLFGKPVVVGEERGIATAFTYSAKALGIKRGDPIYKIRKEYPQVTILSSHFELYRKFAHNLEKILSPYVEEFESYSIDECFATIVGTPEQVKDKVYRMKVEVEKKLGITYSFGVSLNKTLAKVASKRNKPAGICFILSDLDIIDALKTTHVNNIWGIGYATQRKLFFKKIQTAYKFSQMTISGILKDVSQPLFETQRELLGERIFHVGQSNPHQKSLQATRAFIKKTNNKFNILSELSRNLENACGELRSMGLYTNRVYFYVKAADKKFVSIFGDISLRSFTQDPSLILKHIEQLFDKYESWLPGLYRSSGVMLFNLQIYEDIPQDLFFENQNAIENEFGILNTIEKIREKFGHSSIQLARSMISNRLRSEDLKRRDAKDNYEYGLPFPFLGIIK